MQTIILGCSGLRVSRIAFGTWQLDGDWGTFDEAVIATKGGLRLTDFGLIHDASPWGLRQGVETSLAALGVDHIDLYQVHWPDPKVPVAETAGALAELVAEGKIGHVGVSNHDAAELAGFAAILPVETVQSQYHLLRRDIEDELLPYAREHDIGVLAYGSLSHGLLAGSLREDTSSADDEWRASSAVFTDAGHRRITA